MFVRMHLAMNYGNSILSSQKFAVPDIACRLWRRAFGADVTLQLCHQGTWVSLSSCLAFVLMAVRWFRSSQAWPKGTCSFQENRSAQIICLVSHWSTLYRMATASCKRKSGKQTFLTWYIDCFSPKQSRLDRQIIMILYLKIVFLLFLMALVLDFMVYPLWVATLFI